MVSYSDLKHRMRDVVIWKVRAFLKRLIGVALFSLFVVFIAIFVASFASLLAGFSCYAFPFGEAIFKCTYWLLYEKFNGAFVSASATLLSMSALALKGLKEYRENRRMKKV